MATENSEQRGSETLIRKKKRKITRFRLWEKRFLIKKENWQLRKNYVKEVEEKKRVK